MLIGRFASVLEALVGGVKPSALPALMAALTMKAESGWAPAGRMPIVSTFTASRTRDDGQRAFSAASASRTAAWNFVSRSASAFGDSDRRSTSIVPVGEIVLTDVPPWMIPTLNVAFGVVGTLMSAMAEMALPNACIGFGMPNAP